MTLRSALAAMVIVASLFEIAPARAQVKDCSKTSTGRIPINDLGTGTFRGFQGGLYPFGSNERPATHDQALDRTGRMMLLDPSGSPDSANGVFVLISIGNSNATLEFSPFIDEAERDPRKNSRLVLVDCAQSGQTADLIADPFALYWSHVDGALATAGVTPNQVQAVWLKEAETEPIENWPQSAVTFKEDLRAIVQILKSRYPNLRRIYHTSRIYGGYGPFGVNPEPYPYHYGFAVKWLIEDQMNGVPDLNFDPARGPVMAPWMAWGPYVWADGLSPRSDGLIWECQDFQDDGIHPSPAGTSKVVDKLLSFFKSDPTTVPWFLDCDLGASDTFAAPPEVLGSQLRKMGGGRIEVAWESLDPVVGSGAIYDVVGGRISDLRADQGFDRATCLAVGLLDTPYSESLPSPPAGEGYYYLVRGRNSCGFGTWGDSTLLPDARDALDAGSPSCP